MEPNLTLDDAVRRWHALREQGKTAAVDDLCSDCPEVAADLSERLRAVASMAAFLGLTPGATAAQEGTPGGDRTDQGPPENQCAAHDLSSVNHRPTFLGSRFQVLRLLARGGLGNIYEAHDTELGREVALKVIQPR